MRRVLRAIGRAIDAFCDALDSLGAPVDWRVRQHDDGLWYAEWEHIDQGWVFDEPGLPTMVAAAAAGRKRYERRRKP